MKIFSRLRGHRFCAFCKASRRIYLKKHVDLTNVVCAMAFALAVTFVAMGQADGVGIIIFCLFIMGAEAFVYTRWRLSLACKLCGFDPVLYKKSPQKASDRVKEFFNEQVESPEFWLTRSPLLKVQKRIRENEKKAIERAIVAKRSESHSLAPNKTL